MSGSRLSDLLAHTQYPVLDGAMATELEKLSVDTASDLWSAAALLHQPEAIAQVHRSYFEAGAHCATTNTYQANIVAFQEVGLSESESAQLIRQAVHIALQARHEVINLYPGRVMVVAGSVGPYGAYVADGSEYTGSYELTDQGYRDFHRPRLALLQEAGVDCIALETMPNGGEVKALLGLLADEFPLVEAWLSFSLADANHLCDGTPLAEVMPLVNESQQVLAVGLNCTALKMVEPALRSLSALTDKPLLAYPNSGETYDPVTKTWHEAPAGSSLGSWAPRWVEAGARMVGGCCRTSPADIAELAQAVGSSL